MIIVIVAVAIPTLLLLLGQGARQGVNAELEIVATNVSQALMEEIRSKRWDENSPIPPGTASTTLGPDGEATRNAYTDVDDFNDMDPTIGGCTDTVTVNGVTYTRQAVICYVNSADLNTCVDTLGAGCTRTIVTPTNYKKITVTVTNVTIGSVELVTVVTNY